MADEVQDAQYAKRRRAFKVLGTLVALGLVLGFFYRGWARTHISTDDAFVEGAVHIIASRVPGTVDSVRVENNREVKSGEVLLTLDRAMYEQRVREAEAFLEAERSKLSELRATTAAQRTRVASAESAITRAGSTKDELLSMASAREAEVRAKQAAERQAGLDLKRSEALYSSGSISAESYERAKTQYETAEAALEAARQMHAQAGQSIKSQDSAIDQTDKAHKAEEASLVQVSAAIRTQEEQVRRREALLEIERLNLSYTTISAPAKGRVTRRAVEVGNQVQSGQPLMSVVSLADAYIVANYKETQLNLLKPGMKVKIVLDAYPDKTFTGHLESIMAGTGSAFSLFPPENASGNYVKVVQRIPVRIVFDNISEALPYLHIGMSAVPTVLAE